MAKNTGDPLERRRFLQSITVAAGAAGFAPHLYGAVGTASTVPAISPGTETSSTGKGPTVQLAEYATRLRYEEIPADVLQRAKDCVADTVGVILFGAQFPWSQMIIRQARRMGTGKCA